MESRLRRLLCDFQWNTMEKVFLGQKMGEVDKADPASKREQRERQIVCT
jgi:hypothetical protein